MYVCLVVWCGMFGGIVWVELLYEFVVVVLEFVFGKVVGVVCGCCVGCV